jgi:hypothetical protein
MAYDAAAQRVVTVRPWTWTAAGGWIEASPAASPPPRYSHAMTYDAARGVIVLFGGRIADREAFDDTWEWDGVTWTERATAIRRCALEKHVMAYDAARERTVLFGGALPEQLDENEPQLADTWEYDGTTWARR